MSVSVPDLTAEGQSKPGFHGEATTNADNESLTPPTSAISPPNGASLELEVQTNNSEDYWQAACDEYQRALEDFGNVDFIHDDGSSKPMSKRQRSAEVDENNDYDTKRSRHSSALEQAIVTDARASEDDENDGLDDQFLEELDDEARSSPDTLLGSINKRKLKRFRFVT